MMKTLEKPIDSDSLTTMSTATATEAETLFPMPEPTAERQFGTPMERYAHFKEMSEKHGGLLPQNVLSDMLGVGKARISQFVQEGRFETVMIFGRRFVTADSMANFIAEERKTGRPMKAPSMLESVKIGIKVGKEVMGT